MPSIIHTILYSFVLSVYPVLFIYLFRCLHFIYLFLTVVVIFSHIVFYYLGNVFPFAQYVRPLVCGSRIAQRLFPASMDFMLKFTAEALNLPVERLQARMTDTWFPHVSTVTYCHYVYLVEYRQHSIA